jgi:hypothetical protein
MKNLIAKNKIELLMLVLSITRAIASLIVSLESGEGHWFSRSGSIMVLFAVIADFRLGSATIKSVQGSLGIAASLKGFSSGGGLTKNQRRLHTVALTLIIIGTFIWGYGDLLF